MSKLSIVATPIGNLEDITLRALRTLKEADTVLCEDTRVTKKLLSHFDIKTTVKRCDAEKEMECARFVETLLESGKHVAYVSDAGTPGVSDPGARLVAYTREHVPEATIEAVPGASSLTAALSISGVQADAFTYLGFVPHKKGRQTFFEGLASYEHPVVFFESPHRILKTLASLAEQLGEAQHHNSAINRTIVVLRELTKMHEEVVSGTPREVLEYFEAHSERVRGEFVVVVS
jgi:16S rRNA (cytidine1402-2'-O)-methyltransferase